jgi:hypothetical protein
LNWEVIAKTLFVEKVGKATRNAALAGFSVIIRIVARVYRLEYSAIVPESPAPSSIASTSRSKSQPSNIAILSIVPTQKRRKLRVEACRAIQKERLSHSRIHCNAQMPARLIRKHCEPDEAGHRLLKLVTERLGLSARSYSRILKVARTIADLDRSEHIREQHLAEAIQYRSLDRRMGMDRH